MEHQAIVIDESEEEELPKGLQFYLAKSLPNGASSSHTKPVKENKEDQPSKSAWASESGDLYELPEGNETQHQEETYYRSQASLESSLNLIERRLEERRQLQGEGEGPSSSICIFKFPNSLEGVNDKAQQPEIVSVGPYHRGKDHLLKFEEHKWTFLDKLINRTVGFGRSFDYLMEMKALEAQTRQCYADVVLMSSHDFVEMMLLDGCFVIELLRHLGHSEEVINEDDPIFTRPWLIPILIRDLLKLENQLPFFVLQSLFTCSRNSGDTKDDDLSLLVLKVFDLAYPMPLENILRSRHSEIKNLLDLLYSSLLPPNQGANNVDELEEYRPSNQSIQCVTRLRPSGVKFCSRKTASFLDIKFQNRVLEIPTIAINDFTSTLLINCVAWEQCHEVRSKYFTDYVSFMNCLINKPRDVSFLCMDGIISRFSQDDLYVANLFNNLGKNVEFNIRECYLSKQFREVEAYYSSNWATMMRTYFSSPWSIISVFSAFLIIALTMVQTIMSILSYQKQFR